MTKSQALEVVKKEYPNQKIGLGFLYEGVWYFVVGEGENGGIHAVDEKTGFVTGNLPLLAMLSDKKFSEALQNASGAKKNVFNDEFLAHHGILGQKWGVRRYQDKFGRLTPEGKIRYGKGEHDTKDGLSATASLALFNLSAVAVTSAIAITASAVSNHNEKMGDKLLDKKKIADTSKKFSDDNPPKKIEGEHSAEDDMAKVNEAYGGLRPQTLNNCSFCSITMELRRRGFDVCARTSSEAVYTQKQVNESFKPKTKADNITWEDKPKDYDELTISQKRDAFRKAVKEGKVVATFKDVEKNILKKYPEGARGIYTVLCPSVGVGHAMAFEVKNGKVILYDCQSNKKFNLSNPPAAFSTSFVANSSLTYRLDNKELNWSGLNDVCAERIRK